MAESARACGRRVLDERQHHRAHPRVLRQIGHRFNRPGSLSAAIGRVLVVKLAARNLGRAFALLHFRCRRRPALSPGSLSFTALEGIPEIAPGMALAPVILAALERHAY